MAADKPMFSKLAIWCDQNPRLGAANMALDQVLLETIGDTPILRVYAWSQPTVSFGYFHSLQDAQECFPSEMDGSLRYMRRWTGGGVVDHRVDVTYTLIIPRSSNVARVRGAESYRMIHQALARALVEMGQSVQLESQSGDGGLGCFTNPVLYDLSDLTGSKIAGAGQRRSRHGLLHQGSIIPSLDNVFVRKRLPDLLGGYLSEDSYFFQPEPMILDQAHSVAASRYGSSLWINKR